MQIVITLNSAEELKRFLENMNIEVAVEHKEPAQTQTFTAAVSPAVVTAEAAPAPAPVPAPEPAPAPTKTITKQEVQAKAIAQMDAGKQAELQALLKKYGVPALPSVPDDQLAAFYADLEVL